ncbi:PaaX family transcriptional regulator [Marimonas arenosa]|uniref:PaaX family transcriptional regulator n=2 Tax=Marimonas arenosa TaxID=1795305 RepID=A0AAE3WCX7_9RHOB|nr:PaaX family transcriptional regulator [Marimonas arenosa]
MKSATYQEVLDLLLACGAVKTWSLIVTILGDLAAEKGARVSGPVITQLTEPMGMKPEALRVAIHRLKRDGWIVAERDGRQSLYGLTDHGRVLTLDAAARIYGADVPAPETWHVVIAQSSEALQALDFPDLLQIGTKAGLLPGGASNLPDSVLAWEARPGRVPGWVKAVLVPEELSASYAVLSRALDVALGMEPPAETLPRAVLRLLALHQWRRLVLRHSAAVDVLMGRDWAGAACRERVAALLQRLERPDVRHLAVLVQGGGQSAT